MLAQAGSLALTGLFLWAISRPPRFYNPILTSLLLQSLVYALAAWLWSGAMTVALYLMLHKAERAHMAEIALRTSRAAIWFAPATILFSHFSPGALVAAVVLVVSATRSLYDQWRRAELQPVGGAGGSARPARLYDPGWQAKPPASPNLCPASREEPRLHAGNLAPCVAASAAAQGAICAMLLRHTTASAGLLALSTALITVLALSRGVWQPARPATLPRSLMAIAATVLLATTLTVGGLTLRYFRGSGGDGSGAASGNSPEGERARAGEPAPSAGGIPAEDPERPQSAFVGLAQGGYPGVILWPRIKPVATLIEPLPAGHALFGSAPRTVGIPFGGEYWMYRLPYSRPPRDSFFRRGSPVALSFSTTDHFPLQMEARHRLEQSIDIHCCREIRVEIRNGDRYSSGVSLELILSNRQSGRPQSLGTAPVVSVPDRKADPPEPVYETLSFAMPAAPSIQRFDLFRVVFRRSMRFDKSARIAIERFVLVP
jgi:hypothetical protein